MQTVDDPFAGMSNLPDYPKIVLTPLATKWDADKRAWDTTIKVLFNGTWSAAFPEGTSWATLSEIREDRVSITLLENTTGATRSVNLTFTGSDGSTKVFVVNQSAVDPVKWGVSTEEVTIPAAGGSAEIILTSAASKRWRTIMLSDWANLQAVVGEEENGDPIWDYKSTGMGPATLRVVCPANTTGKDRKVKLVFKQTIFQDKVVWVKQLGEDPVATDEQAETPSV